MAALIQGVPRVFFDRFLFVVRIDGVGHAGFNKCSEIKGEAATIEYKEGGSLTPFKSPGMVTFPPVTLERGASTDQDLLEWFEQVIDASQVGPTGDTGVGLRADQFRREVDVIQLSRSKEAIEGWRLFRAWPSSFTAGEFDNDADEKTIRKLDLEYEGFTRLAIAI